MRKLNLRTLLNQIRTSKTLSVLAIICPFFYVVHAEFLQKESKPVAFRPTIVLVHDTISLPCIPDTIRMPGKILWRTNPMKKDTINDTIRAVSFARFDSLGRGFVLIAHNNNRILINDTLLLRELKEKILVTPMK